MQTTVTVSPIRRTDIATVANLIQTQAARLYYLDSRLNPPQDIYDIRAKLEYACGDEVYRPLVARFGEQVIGYVWPGMWFLHEQSALRTFYGARNGILRDFAFRPPKHSLALMAVDTLLQHVHYFWQDRQADMFGINWPTKDSWFRDVIVQFGYMADSATAIRPLTPLPDAPIPPNLTIRAARPDDVDVLEALHIEEVAYHPPHDPLRREMNTPALEKDFRQNMAAYFAGYPTAFGKPVVMVAEQSGEVVGLAECYVEQVTHGNLLPPGKWGYLNSVGVRADKRGHGIGKALVVQTLKALAEHGAEQFYLYFMYYNPLSSEFWPAMGFEPVWTRYTRLAHPPTF